MNNNIELSIVVPVYNVEQYLVQCVESIVGAYRDGIEIILVDDGSKDKSGKICDDFANKYEYIKVIHRENGGLSAARNTGINAVKGKYIWFVDSDDYIEKNSIELLLKEVKKDVDMIFINYQQVTSNGETRFYQAFDKEDNLTIEPYKYLNSLGNLSYAAQKFIVKRELIINNNVFFTEGIYHEDEDWTPRVVCVAKTFSRIMPALYNYRVGNPNSITGMLNPKKVLDKLIVSQNLRRIVDNSHISEDMRNFLKTRVAHNYIAALNESNMYDNEVRKNLINTLKKDKDLLRGIKDRKACLVRNVIKVIGVANTSKLLNARVKIKKDS